MTEELRDLGFEECEWPVDELDISCAADIFELLSKDIMGQDSAKKAVSIIAWDLLQGRRSVNLFVGETGSGKTALFRSLEKHLPIHFVSIDASKITPSGWKGTSIGDALLAEEAFGYKRTILFFDEADAFFKPQIGSAETNHAALVQKDLLTLFDIDNSYVTFASENGKSSKRIWTGNITIIMAGAFQDLFDKKSKPKNTLGFLEASDREEPNRTIEINDLINYGMTKEVAGRIQRVICMDEVDEDIMLQIARHTVHCLEDEYDCSITVEEDLLERIAASAKTSGLGARFIRNNLIRYIDEIQFETQEEIEEIEICD